MKSAKLIIADSEKNANLYYASKFLAPDPFIFFEIEDKRFLVMSDLEIDRAKAQSSVDDVLSFTSLAKEASKNGKEKPGTIDVVDAAFKAREVKEIQVESTFGIAYSDALRARGYEVKVKADPFYPNRMIKTDEEIEHITTTLRVTEDALASAIELIKNSEVRDAGALWIGQKPLTAELVRKTMHLVMMERDCVGNHTIVACGAQAVDPHEIGTGVLKANEPIVMDVFPQHANTRYFADITRTVVKGKASSKVRKMFDAVKEGQEIAFSMIKEGTNGADVHKAIIKKFEELGFKTGVTDGRMQGFFHGTGHGVGVEIHEPPRVGGASDTLKAGMVVTVEPGLYYLDSGGMRLEDMVVVTKHGCENITKAEKVLEV